MAKSMSSAEFHLRQAINQLARESHWQLNRAFETQGCSCSPLRERQEELAKRYLAEKEEFEKSSPVYQEWHRVSREIAAVDQAEHPGLNAVAELAKPFFRVWVCEHLDELTGETTCESLAKQYASAWYAGWRPKKPL
ncbi:MAG: hypothetical protein U1B30_15855 [Pseudomonadota bacterium]|nr:hypothetical protein [Pseudomonadota bacterium]